MAKQFLKNLFGKKDSVDKEPSRSKKSLVHKYAQHSNSTADIGKIFQNWTRNHSDSPQNDLAVQLLQKQIESYEKEIEDRRKHLLEEMKPTVSAVTGFSQKPKKTALSDTDDALPYKPILFDINKVLTDIKAKRAAQLAAKSGQPLPPTKTQKPKSTGSFGKRKTSHTKSIPAKSKAASVRTIKSSTSQATPSQSKPKPTDTLPSSTTSTTSIARSEISNDSENAIEVVESHQSNVSQAPKQDETPSVTTTSSEDSRSASEKQQGFAGILMAMIEEAEKPPEQQKPKEPEKKLTGVELAAMSRNEPQKFDILVLDHTKQCIFVTQPTSEETRNWNDRRARPEAKQKQDDITFNSKQPLESRKFCVDCKPRYPVPN